MSLSNAERQKRHRERTKEKLRNGGISQNDVGAALRNAYIDGARQFLIAFDGVEESAVEALLTEPFTAEDIKRILMMAGFCRLSQHAQGNASSPRKWDRHADEMAAMLRNGETP